MAHLTEAYYSTKLCRDFSSGVTLDLKIKEIRRMCITSRDWSNSHFTSYFSCDYDSIASTDSSYCRSSDTITSLYQYALMCNLLYGSVIDKVGTDTMYLFNHSSNILSNGSYRFCISSIYYFLDSVHS